MVDFNKSRATAKRLIEANGRSITLISDPTAPASASEPERGPDFSTGSTEATVIGAFVPAAGSGFGKDVMRVPGAESLHEFEEFILVAATSLEAVTSVDINNFDRVRDGSTMWTLGMVETLRPADDEIIYQLGIKK